MLFNIVLLLNHIYLFNSRRMRWEGHEARMGQGRGAYNVLEKPEGKRPLGRPRLIWDADIKMDLQEVGWGIGWIDLA
jgi:hypothetical protein